MAHSAYRIDNSAAATAHIATLGGVLIWISKYCNLVITRLGRRAEQCRCDGIFSLMAYADVDKITIKLCKIVLNIGPSLAGI